MSISKTKSGSYQVNVYIPSDVRQALGVNHSRLAQVVKTKLKAHELETNYLNQISQARVGKVSNLAVHNSAITFENFYKKEWLPAYLNGSTGHAGQVPRLSTSNLTQRLFRLHILPLFGSYTLIELNNNPSLVIDKLSQHAITFANVKQLSSYTSQVFAEAKYRKYLNSDNISPEIHRVPATRKIQLKRHREVSGGDALTVNELLNWLNAIEYDYQSQKLCLQDYVMFYLTLFIGDRKSETYGLQWPDISLERGYIDIIHSLDENGNLQPTKERKQTRFKITHKLVLLLRVWKAQQYQHLAATGINPTPQQFVFTYTNARGQVNQPVNPFYLNNRLKTIRKRHPELAKTHPHALRHTFATIAHQGGASMEEISKALTHSDTKTTKDYVDDPAIVTLSTFNKFESQLMRAKEKPANPNGFADQ